MYVAQLSLLGNTAMCLALEKTNSGARDMCYSRETLHTDWILIELKQS